MTSSTDATYTIAGKLPSRVIHPTSDLEVAELLAQCAAAGEAVIPVGGRTLTHIGNPPTRYDVALATDRLGGIIEYTPADLTVVVRAGTTLAEVQRALSEHRQFLPLEPPMPERATVGGALATAIGGPWRARYGTARDLVIGLRVALPSGQIAKSGGRVVKNVAGYDLAKLFIGSYGTLGVMVEAAFKVFPIPEIVQTLVMPEGSIDEALHRARELNRIESGVLSLVVLNEAAAGGHGISSAAVAISIGGTARTVDDVREAIKVLAPHGDVISDDAGQVMHAYLSDLPATANARITSRPSDLTLAFRSFPDAAIAGYPRLGLSYATLPPNHPDSIDDVRSMLAAHGAQLTVLKAPASWGASIDTWGDPGSTLQLMRTVKDLFDPASILSPGRFVGGL